MANIRHIAKLAGVSVSTVSRVLNGHPYVREDKRLAVEQAMASLNYARNMNAVRLLTGKTDMIGVMLPSIHHPYFSRLVEGIADEALQAGLRLVLCQTGYAVEEERKALEMVKEKQMDGLIICSKTLDWEVIVPYAAFGPIIACGEDAAGRIPSVFIDHYASFRAGILHLRSKGHTRIGLCMSRYVSNSSEQRRQAYQEMLASFGEPLREDWMFYDCYDIESGAEVVRKLQHQVERPTAMLVTGDQVAVGMLAEASKLGLSVPQDLAIMGFDNQPIASVLGITTIDNQLDEMGRQSFRMLEAQLAEGMDGGAPRTEIPFRLVERETV